MANFSLKFADGGDQYTFQNVQLFSYTFGNLVAHTHRLPGMSGGYDVDHNDPSPGEVGTVFINFVIPRVDRAQMQLYRNQVYELARLGKRKLYWQPQGASDERWCQARIENISMPQDPAEHTDLHQSVRMVFQVAEPYWYEDETSSTINASGQSSSGSVNNGGNEPGVARVKFAPGVGDSVENPVLERRDASSNVLDRIAYMGTLTANDELIVNVGAKSVTLNGAAAYADMRFLHGRWLLLEPGTNNIYILADNGGDACDVTLYWNDTWR